MYNNFIKKLSKSLGEQIFLSGTPEYQQLISGFNTAVKHTPTVVLRARNVNDISQAVKIANDFKIPVLAQSTGHGALTALTSGLFISTAELKTLEIDPVNQIATIGAGQLWGNVISEAAKYGLTAIAGSSPTVGCVGYMLGGGFGPLIKSHGISVDYVNQFTIVTASGEILQANKEQNDDLYWALAGGGRLGFGIITEMQVTLPKLEKIYGGAIFFDEQHIETVIRKWKEWVDSNPDTQATTSFEIIKFPPLDRFPPPLRGKHLICLHLAFPHDMAVGHKIGDTLKGFAPVYLGDFEELAASEVAKIYNDPTNPGDVWLSSGTIKSIDDQFIDALLSDFGSGKQPPFTAIEIRHVGPQKNGVDNAVSGRNAPFIMNLLGKRPDLFASGYSELESQLKSKLRPWLLDERVISFIAKDVSPEYFVASWRADILARLEITRNKYDPNRIFGYKSDTFLTAPSRYSASTFADKSRALDPCLDDDEERLKKKCRK